MLQHSGRGVRYAHRFSCFLGPVRRAHPAITARFRLPFLSIEDGIARQQSFLRC